MEVEIVFIPMDSPVVDRSKINLSKMFTVGGTTTYALRFNPSTLTMREIGEMLEGAFGFTVDGPFIYVYNS